MYGQRRILKWVFCGRLCDIFTLLSWRIPRVEQNHAAGADCVNLDSRFKLPPGSRFQLIETHMHQRLLY